jgi:hypothetical protein
MKMNMEMEVLLHATKCHNIRANLSAVKVNVISSGFITNIMSSIVLGILKIRVQIFRKLDPVPKIQYFKHTPDVGQCPTYYLHNK